MAHSQRFGMHFVPENCSFPELLAFWQHAEALGYDWISTLDHLLPVWTGAESPIFETGATLAALAASTHSARISTLTLCNGFRPSTLLAKYLATVDHISGGLLELGIGAGWSAREHEAYGLTFPEPAERVRRLDEAVQIIKLLWTEPRASFEGRYYTLREAICMPKPLQKPHPPIWIGGTGEQLMLKLVARRAAGWNTNGYFSAEAYRRKAEVLARHCDAIGRDPAEIRRSVAWVVICGQTDSRAAELANHLQASIDRPLDPSTHVIGSGETCARHLLDFARL